MNSGRNALRHILRAYDIKQIYVPHYTCPVVIDAIKKEGCEIIFYTVTPELKPAGIFPAKAVILYTNYFGVCGNIVRDLAQRYPHLIVDNAQSFYSAPAGMASFYSPRKFFGLPDGGIAVCSRGEDIEYPDDTDSHERASHLLIRPDLGASAGYSSFTDNDAALDDKEIKNMSALTRGLMGNIDCESVKRKRLRNFYFLNKYLEPEKNWDLAADDVPMVYPCFTSDPELRKRLIDNKIFVATYWKGVSEYAEKLTQSIIPLPVDQRYDLEDMKFIIETILGKTIEVDEEFDYPGKNEPEQPECDSTEPELQEQSGQEEQIIAEEPENPDRDSLENENLTPEERRELILRRFRQVKILPRITRVGKQDMEAFIARRNELMPLLREEYAWLKEQQKYHADKKYMLTVLLVTYNHCGSIATAIESVLQQETGYPYVIKILDDCSNDGTAKVCLEYARLYPEKILYCPEVINSGAINITAHIRQIDTPYYTLIDGDDRWCCPDKIQRSIDFLEANPEYSAFTHDTLFCNQKFNVKQSYTHDVLKVEEAKEKLTFDDYFYTHMTARVHRNNIDWKKDYPDVRLRDIYLFYLTLDKGPFYYCDEIMSEYIFSGKGSWSRQSFMEVQYSYNFRRYMINMYTGYRHEKVLRDNTKSRLLNLMVLFSGKRLGWWLYTKYRKTRLLLEEMRKQLGKLDFIEYKHRSYPRYEQAIRDEIWEDRF